MRGFKMNEPIKFCINCKHLKDIKCQRPEGLSLVTGLQQFRGTFAHSERSWNHVGCGEKAKYFELKVEA
jgi:hypothetical protein